MAVRAAELLEALGNRTLRPIANEPSRTQFTMAHTVASRLATRGYAEAEIAVRFALVERTE